MIEDRWCNVVSVTVPYDSTAGFLLFRNSGTPGIEPGHLDL
jgi:hypothetical protein